MQPAVVDQKEQVVIGLATRTTNEAEADPERARLGRLWGRVMEQDIASRLPHQAVSDALYAVLTDYETDQRGEYTQIVGMAVTDLAALPHGLVGVAIPAGRYLVFTARGPMMPSLRYTSPSRTPADRSAARTGRRSAVATGEKEKGCS